jgi:hypothetical protein
MTSSIAMMDVRQKLAGRNWQPAGVYISVNGTGDPSPSDTYNPLGSFASDISQLLMEQQDGLWLSQPIGYAAAVENMEASYTDAALQIVAALGGPAHPTYQAAVYPTGPFVLGGYSQGSGATNTVWTQYIYPEDGLLHHRINDCMSIINFGDIFRTPGIANGNVYQGIPIPGEEDGTVTGGIGQAANNLTAAESTYINPTNPLKQPVIMSWDLPGDLYGSSPQGGAGSVAQSIMNIVFNTSFTNVVKILEDLAHPLGDIEEIYNAIKFFSAGTAAPHWQYANQGCVQSAVNYMLALGSALPHIL